MTKRLSARWKAGARAALQEAGEHVAETIKSTQLAGARLVGAGFLVGLILGAGLVYLGVSLSRRVT